MRLPWRKKHDDSGLKEAERERAISEKKLRESESLRDSLREIRKKNHVGELITAAIEKKVREDTS